MVQIFLKSKLQFRYTSINLIYSYDGLRRGLIADLRGLTVEIRTRAA
jgi:hypothetical protein